jgi:peptidoglycan-associated lipoprotein
MNRKSWLSAWILIVGMSVFIAGCPKKKPDVAPEPAPAPEMTEKTVENVSPAPTPMPVDETPDPLSEDLVTANEYASKNGLLGHVYFDFDQYELRPDARERLAKNADFMKEHPEFMYTIEGHCDERGTNEYNMALGDRRSHAAQSYLMSLGVPASQFNLISYGEEAPLCNVAEESCWSRNRRANFTISGRGPSNR